jgi:hypothetical protein
LSIVAVIANTVTKDIFQAHICHLDPVSNIILIENGNWRVMRHFVNGTYNVVAGIRSSFTNNTRDAELRRNYKCGHPVFARAFGAHDATMIGMEQLCDWVVRRGAAEAMNVTM